MGEAETPSTTPPPFSLFVLVREAHVPSTSYLMLSRFPSVAPSLFPDTVDTCPVGQPSLALTAGGAGAADR